MDIIIWNMVFPDYILETYQPEQSQLTIPGYSYCPPKQPASQPNHQIFLQTPMAVPALHVALSTLATTTLVSPTAIKQ